MLFDGGMSPLQPSGSGALVVAAVPFADPRVQRLVEEVQAHYVVIYGGRTTPRSTPTEFEPPHGLFALGTVDGQEVAMGGWRHRADLTELFDGARVAEIKRMYVAPPAGGRAMPAGAHVPRGHGSRGRGRRAGPETGTMQPDAIASTRPAATSRPCASGTTPTPSWPGTSPNGSCPAPESAAAGARRWSQQR